jgi:hypothetical protein
LEYRSQRALPPPHLIPEDASKTEGIACFESHAKQASEHDEK